MISDIKGLLSALRDNDLQTDLDLDRLAILADMRQKTKGMSGTRHPLGFIHVDISALAPGARLAESFRLHLWGTEFAQVDSLGALHEHTWHLTSLILVGRLRDVNYRAVPREAGRYHGMRVQYGLKNEFLPEGYFDLEAVNERVVGPSQMYTIKSRTVHHTTIVEKPTFTIVRACEESLNSGRGPLVLVRRGLRAEGTPVREVVPPELVADLLRVVGV